MTVGLLVVGGRAVVVATVELVLEETVDELGLDVDCVLVEAVLELLLDDDEEDADVVERLPPVGRAAVVHANVGIAVDHDGRSRSSVHVLELELALTKLTTEELEEDVL